MTTTRDIIKQAMRSAKVLESGEEPEAEEANDALELLNAMMHGFNAMGINFAHTTRALGDPINVPPEEEIHIRYMLCALLCSEYKKEATPTVLAMAENGRRNMQAAYWLGKTAPVDTALRDDSGVIFNYTTGQ